MKKSIKFADDLPQRSNSNIDDELEEANISSRWKSHNFNKAARSSISVHLDSEKDITNNRLTVEIRVIFLKLGIISTKDNKFSCEAFAEATWYDENFFKNSSTIEYDENKHWNPRLYIQNILNNQSQEIWYNIEKVDGAGCKVSERRRFKGEFSQMFDLKKFPFDFQSLSITISSFRNSQEVNLVINKEKLSSVNLNTFTQTHEWILHKTVSNNESLKENEFSTERYSSIEISVCVQRISSYYYWNAFIFIFIITMICLCCFSISCDIVGNRLIVSTTVVLTLITFRSVLTRNLPSISYLTIMDQYSLMNILIVFLNLLYFAIIGSVTQEYCPKPYRTVDSGVFIGSVSVFILSNFLSAIRFMVLCYMNKQRLLKRELEFNKNSSAKRARIKSIFQSKSFDLNIE